jgi:LAO/AO transport system kinase
MMTPASASWRPPVLACSGQSGAGLDEVWATIEEHRAALDAAGELAAKRATQQVDWMWAMVRDQLMDRLRTDPAVRERLPELERDVRAGDLTPTLGAQTVLDLLGQTAPHESS